MSVLPQLERELLAAHDWRRRRGTAARMLDGLRSGAGPAILAGGALIAAAVVAVVVVLGAPGRSSPGSRPGPAAVVAGLHAEVLLRNVEVPRIYTAGGRVYLNASVPAHAGNAVVRLDGSGRQWRRGIPDPINSMILAGGRLWVTTNDPNGITRLWQLNADSLTPLGAPIVLPGSGTGNFVGELAATPGRLWVSNGDRIDSVPLGAGRVTSIAPLPSWGYDIAAQGTTLYYTGGEGNPGTHAFLGRLDVGGSSPPALRRLVEPYAPSIAGVGGGAAIWIARFDGRRIIAERWRQRNLVRVAGTRAIVGFKGLGITLAGGILWVSQSGAGPGDVYCADPVTGERRASLSLPAHVQFLGADERYVYYSIGLPRSAPELARAPIDPRCR